MKSLLGIGWVGQGDFGDEAMAFALRTSLAVRAISPPTPYLQGPESVFRMGRESLPHALHRGDQPSRLHQILDPLLLRPYAALMVGGGSILHSETSILWKLRVIEQIRRRHSSTFIASVGVSVGPFSSPESERLCSDYLRANDFVITRDIVSAEVVSRLSSDTRVIAARDLSFVLPAVAPEAWRQATSGTRDGKTVAVSFVRKNVGQPVNAADEDVCRAREIVDGLLSEGRTVRLFTLYTGGHYQDRELHNLIQKNASHPEHVEHHVFGGDIFKTISALHACGSVLSSRLHGIIFAHLLGIPFVSLEYHRKNSDFCKTIGYPKAFTLKDGATRPKEVLTSMRELSAHSPQESETPEQGAKLLDEALDALAEAMKETS